MARYPGAIWKPITASKGRRRLTIYNRMNLHVAVSEGSSLHAFFNKSGQVDSHFYVRRDGTVEQYVDTAFQAFADLEGNDATISVETQGMGTGGWDPAQRETLARLYAWAVKTHGIARKMATSSRVGASSRGLSWHRLGCDGNFPALPSILAGRTQRGGGMHYSKSLGKVCPGDDRIKQIPGIFARAEAILAGSPTTPTQEEDMPSALDETQAAQLSTIAAAVPELLEIHAALIGDDRFRKLADGRYPMIDATEASGPDAPKVTTRTNAKQVRLAVFGGLATTVAKAVVKELPDVDPTAVTKAVTDAVDKALADIEITLTKEP